MMSAQHAHQTAPTIPRGALYAAAALLVAAVVAVAAVRLSGVDVRAPDAAAAVTRSLLVADLPDGDVAVIDARDGSRVATMTGESGFFRGTLRALARERKRAGFGPELPFDLIGRADGRLTLVDPSTGRMVDLESFGPTNAAVFVRLLPPPPARP
jgi:putative photosynthetic complex assembly protein